MTTRSGSELKRGDIVRTWFGDQTIVEMRPYDGPFDFICGVAKFPQTEMSIERNGICQVLFTR